MPMLIETCAYAIGTKTRPASKVAVETSNWSLRIVRPPLRCLRFLKFRGTLCVAVMNNPATAAAIRSLEWFMEARKLGSQTHLSLCIHIRRQHRASLSNNERLSGASESWLTAIAFPSFSAGYFAGLSVCAAIVRASSCVSRERSQ